MLNIYGKILAFSLQKSDFKLVLVSYDKQTHAPIHPSVCPSVCLLKSGSGDN